MKYDRELGMKVETYLRRKGVETPINYAHDIHHDSQIFQISKAFVDIMIALGLDISDDSLHDTPARLAKMYVDEIFCGLDYANFPKCTTLENKMGYDEMVLEKNITCISTCEHHFTVIDQVCHIAYIPRSKVIGLSKLNRIAKFFARRPQVQERFVEQVYWALSFILEIEDIAVVAEGKHFCVVQRGIEDHASSTITSKLGGKFKVDPKLRAEFMSFIK